ncbi:hypothetical protein ACIF8W_28780 [Streptomyces sp. NPDC085639]|uniref:hypothetical protein n=1 Tax=Streptomyces sp. NPDC085639 TaxID=3365734 RepID=UPI0037D6A21C
MISSVSRLNPEKPLGVIAMDYVEKSWPDGRWDYVGTDLIDAVIAWNPKKPDGSRYAMTLDRAELVSFDDGTTDPSIYGRIRIAAVGFGPSSPWSKALEERVKFLDSRGDFELSGPERLAISNSGFVIAASLYDYDATSSHELVAGGTISWHPSDGVGTWSKDLYGVDGGHARFGYSVRRLSFGVTG